MESLPESWITASTIFFILGSVAMALIALVSVGVFWILLDLRKMISGLNVRVTALTEKVDGIATNVKDVTDEVGVRARGITRVVDEHAQTAFGIVEKVAPLFLAIGIVTRIAKLVKSR